MIGYHSLCPAVEEQSLRQGSNVDGLASRTPKGPNANGVKHTRMVPHAAPRTRQALETLVPRARTPRTPLAQPDAVPRPGSQMPLVRGTFSPSAAKARTERDR